MYTWRRTCTQDNLNIVLYEQLSYITAVALGTVGTVPTVPLFLDGTANRTTISTEKNNFEMKKGYSLILRI
jgi:hypothetical protein